nr:MAG TPA: hypothetical protein [Bacteriophage sp.]
MYPKISSLYCLSHSISTDSGLYRIYFRLT